MKMLLLLAVVVTGLTQNAYSASKCDIADVDQVLTEATVSRVLSKLALKDSSPDGFAFKAIQAAYMQGDFAVFKRFVDKMYGVAEGAAELLNAAKLLVKLRKTPNLSPEFTAKFDLLLEDPFVVLTLSQAIKVFVRLVEKEGEPVELSEVEAGDCIFVPGIGFARVNQAFGGQVVIDGPSLLKVKKKDHGVFTLERGKAASGEEYPEEMAISMYDESIKMRTGVRLSGRQVDFLSDFSPAYVKRSAFFKSASSEDRAALWKFWKNPTMAKPYYASTQPFLRQIAAEAERIPADEVKAGEYVMVNEYIGKVKSVRETKQGDAIEFDPGEKVFYLTENITTQKTVIGQPWPQAVTALIKSGSPGVLRLTEEQAQYLRLYRRTNWRF